MSTYNLKLNSDRKQNTYSFFNPEFIRISDSSHITTVSGCYMKFNAHFYGAG